MNAEAICRELGSLHAEGATLAHLKRHAVQRIHEAEDRFHWTGIYDLFPDETLRLGPFIGAPTNHVFIGVGQGVCGTAVAERRNMNIPDVLEQTNYLACSAETRSELVVLIRSGNRIHAQIDIDSHDRDAFGGDLEDQVQQVADCLAGFYEGDKKHRAA